MERWGGRVAGWVRGGWRGKIGRQGEGWGTCPRSVHMGTGADTDMTSHEGNPNAAACIQWASLNRGFRGHVHILVHECAVIFQH